MAQSQQVVSTDYPFLQVRVEIRGQRVEELALTDTGFEGAAAVPENWADETLGDPEVFRFHSRWLTGAFSYAPVFVGSVEIVGFSPIADIPITVPRERVYVGPGCH